MPHGRTHLFSDDDDGEDDEKDNNNNHDDNNNNRPEALAAHMDSALPPDCCKC